MSKFSPFLEAREHITKAQSLLSQGPAKYYTEQFIGAYEYLMKTFAPFKTGDAVILIKVLDPMPSGWTQCAHFIKLGATATIKNVECDKDGFIVDVEFDEESWVNSTTKEIILLEPDRRHTFGFRSNYFVKVGPSNE